MSIQGFQIHSNVLNYKKNKQNTQMMSVPLLELLQPTNNNKNAIIHHYGKNGWDFLSGIMGNYCWNISHFVLVK